MLIGIIGHIGSGKTESASYLSNKLIKLGHSVGKLHFSYSLKHMVKKYYGITKHGRCGKELSENEFKQRHIQLLRDLTNNDKNDFIKLNNLFSYKIPYTMYLNNNGRRLLQWLGTTVARKHISKDYWLNRLFSIYDNIKNYFDYIIIDDIRFINEFNAIRNNKGKIIFIDSTPEVNSKRINKDIKEYLLDLEYEKDIKKIYNLFFDKMHIINNHHVDLNSLYKQLNGILKIILTEGSI